MKTYVWTILALTLIVFACKKFSSETTSNQSTLFHIENAKEWFYGVFKKTSEFKYGDANAVFNADKQPIKKTPDWRYAIQYKAGDLEIVEMPLFADRRNVFIPNAKGVTENDKARIARATIENILFVNGKDGVIKVRIVQLIPDVDYASSKNFDISNNSANHIDKEFDGWIVVRDWMGKISRFSKIENGRIVKSLENTPSNQFKKSNSREVCGWVQVEIERRTCIIVNEIGDVAVPNLDECTNYSVSYTYDWRWDCTDDGSDEIDCTTDAMPEVCFCNVYSICGNITPSDFDDEIKDSLDHECLKNILARLKTINGGKIGEVIYKFSGTIPSWDWVVKEGPTGTSNAETNDNSPNGCSSVFDFSKVKNATDLGIARLMLHEALHAYLVNYFHNDPNAASKEYSVLVSDFFTAEDPSTFQHEIMGNNLVNSIAAALMDFGQKNGYTVDSQVYHDLAWGGLYNSASGIKAFNKLTGFERERIRSRNAAENSGLIQDDQVPAGQKICIQ